MCVFFFSSRRRHTRWNCDWSSDVCSSDLPLSRGSKVDNLVQVGHGSKVGERTLLCAQVGLAGSTEVGNDVILAGQVGVAGHCSIGDGVIATAQSGIPNDVAAGKVVSGYPAIDNRQWLRAVAIFSRLPELARSLRASKPLEKRQSATVE